MRGLGRGRARDGSGCRVVVGSVVARQNARAALRPDRGRPPGRQVSVFTANGLEIYPGNHVCKGMQGFGHAVQKNAKNPYCFTPPKN